MYLRRRGSSGSGSCSGAIGREAPPFVEPGSARVAGVGEDGAILGDDAHRDFVRRALHAEGNQLALPHRREQRAAASPPGAGAADRSVAVVVEIAPRRFGSAQRRQALRSSEAMGDANAARVHVHTHKVQNKAVLAPAEKAGTATKGLRAKSRHQPAGSRGGPWLGGQSLARFCSTALLPPALARLSALSPDLAATHRCPGLPWPPLASRPPAGRPQPHNSCCWVCQTRLWVLQRQARGALSPSCITWRHAAEGPEGQRRPAC